MPEAQTVDAATIDAWRREHHRAIEESEPGSYQQHLSGQMLMVLGDLDAARAQLAASAALVAAAERLRNATTNDEKRDATYALLALAVQPAASVARGEGGDDGR